MVYRKLQRQGIPFATGVLHKNDVDYQAAIHLASRVISEESFEPISQFAYEQALQQMSRCSQVICCLDTFGTMNERNRKLLEEARRMGKLREKL